MIKPVLTRDQSVGPYVWHFWSFVTVIYIGSDVQTLKINFQVADVQSLEV